MIGGDKHEGGDHSKVGHEGDFVIRAGFVEIGDEKETHDEELEEEGEPIELEVGCATDEVGGREGADARGGLVGVYDWV